MRQNYYTKQELMAMPLGKINRLVLGDGIQDQEEEALINEVLNAKRGFTPVQQNVVLRKDIDIKTQEQEKQWEAELERRKAEMRPVAQIQDEVAPIGDPLSEPSTVPDVPNIPEPEPIPVKETAKVKKANPVKCEQCGSRIARHKEDCPTLKK